MTVNQIIKKVLEELYKRSYTEKNLLYDSELIEEIESKFRIDNSLNTKESKFLIHNRKYLKAKTRSVDFIKYSLKESKISYTSFLDIFGGTGVVSESFNNKDTQIIINDILYSNYIIYKAWFSDEKYDKEKLELLVRRFNEKCENIPESYISKNFSSTYFSVKNALKIGYIRNKINLLKIENKINEKEEAILLTSLLYAVDKVANVCGTYDSFNKVECSNELYLRFPDINLDKNKENKIYREDANELIKKVSVDIAYIDPPFDSRQYCDHFHLLENIVLNKEFELEGKGKKFKERKVLKSKYSTKDNKETLKELIDNIDCKYILLSYTELLKESSNRDKKKTSYKEVFELLESRGKVEVFENKFQTSKSKEYLLLCRVNQSNNLEFSLPEKFNNYYEFFDVIPEIDLLNINANKKIYISKQENIVEFYSAIKNNNLEKEMEKIAANIRVKQEFLSETTINFDKLKEISEASNIDINALVKYYLRFDFNNILYLSGMNNIKTLNKFYDDNYFYYFESLIKELYEKEKELIFEFKTKALKEYLFNKDDLVVRSFNYKLSEEELNLEIENQEKLKEQGISSILVINKKLNNLESIIKNKKIIEKDNKYIIVNY